jgi:hypothetical protein
MLTYADRAVDLHAAPAPGKVRRSRYTHMQEE